ncbi:MAG TPA: choice-of-anchor tandem repeat GloVer-containing protein [Rhizomicrobium sp.]|jgi:uncharacterized repeat protein (TIGR03803 family)
MPMMRVAAAAAFLFAFSPASQARNSETVLHTFAFQGDGGFPLSGLAADLKGNLYGTVELGGPGTCGSGCGNVFELTRNNGVPVHKVIHVFQGSLSDGGNPAGSPILDSHGNLYGTTISGGDAGCGVVYELSPAKKGQWAETILHSFNSQKGNDDGCAPYSYLVFDASGNLYGTTNKGGGGGVGGTFCENGCGTVFRLVPNGDGTWTESVIHSFPGTVGNTDGQNPFGGLAFDSKGDLWGTTQAGGTGGDACNPFGSPPGCGTVFELTQTKTGKWKEAAIYSFQDSTTGWDSFAGPVIDAQDNVYGPLVNGGPGNGAIFKIAVQKDGSLGESLIYTFAPCDEMAGCLDGVFPFGGLTLDSSGNLYGTTDLGGAASFVCNPGGERPTGCGTVFKLTPRQNGKWKETLLYRFVGNEDGSQPSPDRLVITAKGDVFGTATDGGDLSDCPGGIGCGVVFKTR